MDNLDDSYFFQHFQHLRRTSCHRAEYVVGHLLPCIGLSVLNSDVMCLQAINVPGAMMPEVLSGLEDQG